jgi:hypothetical protein
MALDRTWYDTLINDDGSNTTGTVWNKAAVDSLMDAVDASLATVAPLASPTLTGVPAAPTAALGTSTTQLATTAFTAAALAPGTSAPTTTGTQTALAIPAGAGDLVLYLNNATLLTVQGIAAGLSGQRLTLFSKGAGQVDFAHLHASGTALGKLKLVATIGLTSLAPGSGNAVFQYDATVTQWRLISHEQGDWITPTYAGGNFTAAGGGSWTVDSGDVGQYEFYLKGRELHVAVSLNTTTVTGTVSTFRVALPNGYTQATAAKFYLTMGYANENAVRLACFFMPGPLGSTFVSVSRLDGANWGVFTNLTSIYGIAICRVD